MRLFTICIVSMLLLAAGSAWAEVNINRADASELSRVLKNVGPAKAAAIVEYRKLHGNFKSVDELTQVHGIGKATVEMNQGLITLDDPAPVPASGAGVGEPAPASGTGVEDPAESNMAASEKSKR